MQRSKAARKSQQARDDRLWQRIVITVKRLEALGHDFKGPLNELEKSTHGVSLDDVDAVTCSRYVNMYVKKIRGEQDYKALVKLKTRTYKRNTARERAKAKKVKQGEARR